MPESMLGKCAGMEWKKGFLFCAISRITRHLRDMWEKIDLSLNIQGPGDAWKFTGKPVEEGLKMRKPFPHLLVRGVMLIPIAICDFAFAQQSIPKAGIVLVTEGETFLDGNTLQLAKDATSLFTTGQTLSTEQGRIELILESHAFLSLGENASLRMQQGNRDTTELNLEHGSVLIEVAEKLKNPIRVQLSRSSVEMSQPGLYRLDSSPCRLRVYGGVALADNESKKAQAKKERQIRLDETNLTQSKFDLKDSDALHQWSARHSFDIFLANPETDNWMWMELQQLPCPPPGFEKYALNKYYQEVQLFVNSNYRIRFQARMPSKYAERVQKVREAKCRSENAARDAAKIITKP